MAHNRPTDEQADALRQRTDGNPFYLVEYARLAGERGDLARLVAEEHPPAGVQEVLTRRLERLPEDTVAALRSAAVIGRAVRPRRRSRSVADVDPDDLLDILEPAQVAGLVREDGIERFRFAHALVRDTLVAAIGAVPPGPAARPGRRGPRGPPRPRDRGGPALAGRRPDVRRPGLAGGGGRGRGGPPALRPRAGRRPAPRRRTPRWPTTPTPRPGSATTC